MTTEMIKTAITVLTMCKNGTTAHFHIGSSSIPLSADFNFGWSMMLKYDDCRDLSQSVSLMGKQLIRGGGRLRLVGNAQ